MPWYTYVRRFGTMLCSPFGCVVLVAFLYEVTYSGWHSEHRAGGIMIKLSDVQRATFDNDASHLVEIANMLTPKGVEWTYDGIDTWGGAAFTLHVNGVGDIQVFDASDGRGWCAWNSHEHREVLPRQDYPSDQVYAVTDSPQVWATTCYRNH
jgi:hypothetical protein